MRCIPNSHDILLSGLKTHRDKAETMTSDVLCEFSYEHYAVTHDHESSTKLSDHTLNSASHFLPEIFEAAYELRNSATKLRYDKLRHAQVP